MRLRVLVLICLMVLPAIAAGETESELQAARDVQLLLQENDLAKAEKTLTEKLKEFPESPRVNSLRMNFAYAYRRANQHDDALRHMQRLVDYYLDASQAEPELYTQLANSLAAMGSYSRVADKIDVAKTQFEGVLEQLAERQKLEDKAAVASANGAVHGVRLRLIDFLMAIAEYEAAQKHLDDELALAKQEYDAQSDSTEYILHLANALRARVALREELGKDGVEDARTRQLAFLQLKVQEHLENPLIVAAYLEAHIASVTALSRTNPDEADRVLTQAKALIKTLDPMQRGVGQQITIAERTFPYLEQTIATGKQHARLLNQPAAGSDFIAWSNGDAIPMEKLKGKVVLLDFWAVWCGPCLESFPHLNRWHEKYAGQGLQIVGVTKFYNYVWDDQNKRPEKFEKGSPPQAEELAMLKKFADLHQLKYPLAVTKPGSEYQKLFGVTAIPQTVLIDREGKIRLIRVGTGARICKEIERELQALLKEAPPKAVSGKSPAAK